MLGIMGISEWVPALIALWLAAQLPLGMFVGSYLRRAAVLSTADAGPVAIQRGRTWQELLPASAMPAGTRAL